MFNKCEALIYKTRVCAQKQTCFDGVGLDSRGNVVAVVLFAALIGVMLVVLMIQRNPELQTQIKDPSKQIVYETKYAVQRAIENGIIDFAQAGDGNAIPWYSDTSLPPRLDEARDALRKSIFEDFNKLRNSLVELKGYKIENPEQITLGADSIDVDDWKWDHSLLDDANFDFNVLGIKAGIDKNGKTKVLNIDYYKKRETRIWFIYNKLVEWAETDFGGITEQTNTLIGQCQSVRCIPHAAIGTTSAGAFLSGWSASESAVKSIVDNSVAMLNNSSYFAGTDVTCSLENFEYHEKQPEINGRRTVRSDYCGCPGGETFYHASTWNCDIVPADFLTGCLNTSGPATVERSNNRWFESPARGASILQNTDTGPSGPFRDSDNENVGFSFTEMIGSRAAFSARYAVKCVDSKETVATAADFEPLSTVLLFELSVMRYCDPPPSCYASAGAKQSFSASDFSLDEYPDKAFELDCQDKGGCLGGTYWIYRDGYTADNDRVKFCPQGCTNPV